MVVVVVVVVPRGKGKNTVGKRRKSGVSRNI